MQLHVSHAIENQLHMTVAKWQISSSDVKTAFLNGELEEDIYMDQPQGFVQDGKEDLVCKLKKSLYGLK